MIFTKRNAAKVDPELLVSGKVENHELSKLLLIVPTNRLIRHLRKEFLFKSPGQFSGVMNLDTLATFSEKIFRETHDVPGKEISEAAAIVLLRQSFKEIKRKYFASFSRTIPEGTLKRIMNVISEYKRHGISPVDLRKEAETLSGSEKLKAAEIADVYEKYIEKFTGLSLFELGDIYKNILSLPPEEFNKRFRKLYPDADLILVKGFDEFTAPETEIINNLSGIEKASFYLDLDYESSNSMVFGHLVKTFHILQSKGFIYYNIVREENKEFREIIRTNLYSGSESLKKDYSDRITIIEAADKEKEIDLIAKQIKEILLINETEASSICVAFNMISSYANVIRDRFTLYGIPFNLTDRFPLNCSPVVISIFNLLEILENEFYYKNIIRAFGSDLLDSFGVDAHNLQKCAAELRIISGIQNWSDTLNANLNNNPAGYGKALRDIEKINSLLSPFNKKLSPSEFKSVFHDFLNKLELSSKVLNIGSLVEQNIKALTLFIETADEVLSLVELENGELQKFPAKYYIANIRTAVNSSRYNVKEKPGSGVLVTSINEIRGLEFDYLMLGGLNDGDFPLRYSPEIFYSGSYFIQEEKHSAEERYHFYQVLCSWRKKLWVSYALTDGKAELTRSSFLNDLSLLFLTARLTESNFNSSVYSREELLKYLGAAYPEITSAGISGLMGSIELDKIIRTNPDSEYNGMLGDSYEYAANAEFSITQLETYGQCPFRYYCERVLKLKPVEEPTEDMEASEMGSLLHYILYQFYRTIRQDNILLPSASPVQLKFAEELIFKIAEQKINEEGYTTAVTFFERERILGIGGDKKNSILYQFLETEKKGDPNYIPEFFEEEFGGEKKVDVGEISLRGKIDRIDINYSDKTFHIIDYKLSKKVITKDDLQSGISLQVPLYMYAASEIIKKKFQEEYRPAGGFIYSLKFKSGDFGRTMVKIGKGTPLQEAADLIKIALEHVNNFYQGITGGRFNLTTHHNRESKICTYCAFNTICRVGDFE